MRVHIEPDWARRAVKVYILDDHRHSVLRLARTEDGPPGAALRWDEQPLNVDLPEPTLVLPDDVFEALVAAGGNYLPPSRAIDEALRDTREVRDRLLVLVEKAMNA